MENFPGSKEGSKHAVLLVSMENDNTVKVVSWGKIYTISEMDFNHKLISAYAISNKWSWKIFYWSFLNNKMLYILGSIIALNVLIQSFQYF